MKRCIPLLGIFTLVLAVFACQDDPRPPDSMLVPLMEEIPPSLEFSDNTLPDVVPEATVPLLDFSAASLMNVDPEGTITPEAYYDVLPAGGSRTEAKSVNLPPGILPEIADIMFSIDLTGSMGGEYENVRNNSTNIMSSLAVAIDDVQFGLMSHMDYPGSYSGCGYASTYGYSSFGDYAYSLDQGLTSNTALVSGAIAALSLGDGADGPESYTRVMYEAAEYTGWRTDAAKFLLMWGDNVPHDCNFGLDCGLSGSKGPDPGIDGIAGNADDLNLATVLAELDDAGVTLVSLHSGENNSLWDCYADKTGGSSFQIDPDGTIPGGVDIADFILEKIAEVSQDIDDLVIEGSAGFEDWVSSNTIGPVNLADQQWFNFDVQFTVPEGTAEGIYNFQACVYADGATLDVCQDVQIVVPPEGAFVTGGGWIDSPPGALNPVGLPLFEGSYYEMVDAPNISWENAKLAAEGSSLAGCGYPHLVTITSQDEQEALDDFFGGALQGKWYGGYQTPGMSDPAAGWNWVTGETWGYTNWAPGEPNDVNTIDELYLEGWVGGWGSAWNDEHNLGLVTGYVIEYDDCDLGPTGKANFGFVAKYKKGASSPDGNTEFQFHAGDLNFHSTSYEWLLVTGSNYAKFKGEGTINGEIYAPGIPYKFMLWAGDDDPDTFRIRIWWEEDWGAEHPVYDNFSDQPLGGGSIVIHTK